MRGVKSTGQEHPPTTCMDQMRSVNMYWEQPLRGLPFNAQYFTFLVGCVKYHRPLNGGSWWGTPKGPQPHSLSHSELSIPLDSFPHILCSPYTAGSVTRLSSNECVPPYHLTCRLAGPEAGVQHDRRKKVLSKRGGRSTLPGEPYRCWRLPWLFIYLVLFLGPLFCSFSFVLDLSR